LPYNGDTLTLLVPDGTSYKQVKVRLGEIDTPESKQPYGNRAKQALSDLAFNQQARVVVQDTDRYGRTVGRVYVGGVDVNAEMVKQGARLGVPAICERPVAVPAGSGSQGRQAGTMGTAGSRAVPALGLAARDVRHRLGPGDPRAGCPDRCPNLSQQRRLHLRRQAVLPGNDELRGGEVLPDAVRGSHTGRQS
jgi:hypothetical protein